MNPQELSAQYTVKRIENDDIPHVYELCQGNPLYYKHCPPFVTVDGIRKDMVILPDGKKPEDKYYLGFWQGDFLAAVMDLISEYPDKETAFIGFFMMNEKLQGTGTGSRLIQEVLKALKRMGYGKVRLLYVKANPQSEHFWRKNHFMPTGKEVVQENYTVVVMETELKKLERGYR